MNLTMQIKKVTRGCAIFIFTLLEILGLPRIPFEKKARTERK